ncbi:MAG: HD domain-containing phosphohydrolase [Myxococcota bacterium]
MEGEAPAPRLDARAVRTRVGRRVLAAFLAGSLLPVTLFAVYAYDRVREHLVEEEKAALADLSRSTGMAIVERLLLADARLSLELAQGGLAAGDVRAVGASGVRDVALRDAGALDVPLTARERARLRDGGSVLRRARSTARADGALELLRERPTGELAVASLEPRAIFAPERTRSGELYWVVDDTGALLFAAPDASALDAAGIAPDTGIDRGAVPVGDDALAARWPIFLDAAFGRGSWSVGQARPLTAAYSALEDFEALFPRVAAIAIAAAIGLTFWQVRRTLGPLAALSEAARAVSRGNYAARAGVTSDDEFGELARTFDEMAEQVARQIETLRRLNEIGTALSAKEDGEALVHAILVSAGELTGAQAATLFAPDFGDGDELRDLVAVRTWSAEAARHGADASATPPARLALEAVRRGIPKQEWIGADPAIADDPEWRAFARTGGFAIGATLALPLRTERGDLLGAIVLLREAVAGACDPFLTDEVDVAESLASQAAVALRHNRQLSTLRALFEGVIDLTVSAIDEKSRYTGDHCRRVPVLTEMIADAACAARSGPLKDFALSPEERYELHIAALLHDCGKVVTPVHVMDKATKLETIFDRVEIVRLRHEVLRRELAARGGDDAAAHLRQLDDDLAFVEHANVGGEFMTDDALARIRAIAARWRFERADGTSEPLIDARDAENLSIRRGTLNDDERKVINDHVVMTIRLLEELPFPRELRNVPAIAGAHHERIDGTGYPNRLARDEISMQGRMLGLADVFEALTAKDRPYKPGKTLSETLRILRAMVEEGHIDADLFEVFLADDLHLRYAAAYLSPEQIDPEFQEAIERLTSPWDGAAPHAH